MPKKTLSGKERRQSVRARRVLSIQYRLLASKRRKAKSDFNLSMTEDMSLDGLSFYSEQEFFSGEELEINVVMSGVLDIYKGKATVVRAEKRDAGSIFLIAVKFNLPKRSAARYSSAPKVRTALRKSLPKR